MLAPYPKSQPETIDEAAERDMAVAEGVDQRDAQPARAEAKLPPGRAPAALRDFRSTRRRRPHHHRRRAGARAPRGGEEGSDAARLAGAGRRGRAMRGSCSTRKWIRPPSANG